MYAFIQKNYFRYHRKTYEYYFSQCLHFQSKFFLKLINNYALNFICFIFCFYNIFEFDKATYFLNFYPKYLFSTVTTTRGTTPTLSITTRITSGSTATSARPTTGNYYSVSRFWVFISVFIILKMSLCIVNLRKPTQQKSDFRRGMFPMNI